MRTAYFILGMHRSGTSALASTIDSLGITLGESLLPASEDNPKGYFENKAVQEFNESLLVNRGHGWDDVFFDLADIEEFDYKRLVASATRILEKEFGVFESFAVKDPRICLLLPIWVDACRQLGVESKVILTHRHPLEIAQSLKKRNGMSAHNALALWAEYMFKAEIYSRPLERILVSYDALLNDFESTASSIVSFTGSDKVQTLEPKSIVDKTLRHHKTRATKLSEAPSCISDLLTQYEKGTLVAKSIDAAMRDFSSLKGFFFNAARTSLFQQVFDERRKYKALKDDYFTKLKVSEKNLNAANIEIESMRKVIEKQKADKKSLTESIQHRDERIRNDVDKIKVLEKEINYLTHESQKAELFSIQQQQKLELVQAKAEQLIAVNKELLESEAEVERQCQKVESLEIKLSKIEAELTESNKACSEASAARDKFEQKSIELANVNESLTQALKELEASAARDKFKQKSIEQANSSLTQALKELEASVSGNDKRLTECINTIFSPILSVISDYNKHKKAKSGLNGKWKTILLSRRLENAVSSFDSRFALVKLLPSSFTMGFDESGYFVCNEDVEVAVDNGEFESGFDHFLKFGFQETMDGKRKLHPKGTLFNPASVQSGDVRTAFISYLSDYYNVIAKRQHKVNSITESTAKLAAENVDDATVFDESDNIVALPVVPTNLERRPAPNHVSALKVIPSVDIILPVYNALEDVKACVESLYVNQTIPFNLIVIDDCSEHETQSWLESAQKEYGFTLSRNTENMRFTKTVNRGFAKSSGDYVVLLNSDTIVTAYWIEKILCCFQSDNATGIVGPLSNAASWQTVPVREDKINGGWLVNEIPEGYSIELLGQLIETISQRQYPNVPSVNGFCYVIKRNVIDEIGTLDEEYFPTGYGEEDDFSIRARKAGFTIRVADDTYVFHAKSKSYTQEVRKVLTVGGRKSLDKKHGKDEIEKLIAMWKAEPLLPQIGKDIESYMQVSSGNKKVVFTAIFGNYDNLKTPEYVNPDWDYICFTDNNNIESDVFQVKYVNPRFDNTTKNARMIKLLSHLFLINYDYSLWVDGSVKLRGKNINDLITHNLASDYISLHNHIKRDCVYEEADACMIAKKDGMEILAKQIAAYKHDGLPESAGIFETAEIARNHRAPEVSMLNSLWWQQLDAFSIRDQIALPYVFWKHDFKNHTMEGYQWLDAYFHMYKHKPVQRKVTLSVEIIVNIASANSNVMDIVSGLFDKTAYESFIVTVVLGKDVSLDDSERDRLLESYSNKLTFKQHDGECLPSDLNRYVKNSSTQLCCLLTENVALFNSDWLDVLIDDFKQDTKATIAGPTILSKDFDFVAASVRVKRKNGVLKEIFNARKIGGTGAVLAIHESCLLIDTEHFVKLGGFNRVFKSLRSAVVELCHRNTEDKKHNLLVANSEVMISNDSEKIELEELTKLM